MGNNYVDGIGAEVFSLKTLTKIADNAIGAAHLEHVTKFLWDHSTDFTIETIRAPVGLNHTEISLDIDTSEDFYGDIISTRNYDDRLETLNNTRNANVTICSGGIIGMGESDMDRIKMLLT